MTRKDMDGKDKAGADFEVFPIRILPKSGSQLSGPEALLRNIG